MMSRTDARVGRHAVKIHRSVSQGVAMISVPNRLGGMLLQRWWHRVTVWRSLHHVFKSTVVSAVALCFALQCGST
ncbi:unnamed protein product, partial [Ectocarpus sp. 13 AM-2016]